MYTYTLSFRSNSGCACNGSSLNQLPNQTIKADMYRFEDGFVHFYLKTEDESIASFVAADVLSVIKTV